MKVVELFAGIGGFRIACDELGIKTVWANDIDAKASKVYRSNFGSKEHAEGDVEGYIDQIPKHDLLTGGFPCQPFSSAGSRNSFSRFFSVSLNSASQNSPDQPSVFGL